MNVEKRVITLLISFAMIFSLFGSVGKVKADKVLLPISVSEVSNEVNWSIDESGHLEVSGTGEWESIYIYGDICASPWWIYREYIVTATVSLENIKNVSGLFYQCNNLIDVNLTDFDTSNVTNMSYMFYGCSNLAKIDISKLDTKNVTNMHCMFSGCNSLAELDVSKLDTKNVTDMGDMFGGCSSLTELDISRLETANVTNMSGMFGGCSSLTELDISRLETANVTNMSYMFGRCSSLTELDISKLETANVTNMGSMFSECSGLTELDISKLETANVTDMGGMFSECSGLTELDISKLETANVTSMSGMFSGCSGLTLLNVSKLETGNVTNMSWMFANCLGLTELDVSGFDTKNVEDMTGMFPGCSQLKKIDVNGFNTEKVKFMDWMFSECKSLEEINLSSFNLGKITNISNLLMGCDKLSTIYTPFNLQNSYYSLPEGIWKDEDNNIYSDIPCNLTVSKKLTKYSENEYISEVIALVEKTLSGITGSNDTTSEIIQDIIDVALGEAGIMGVTVTVGKLDKKNATTSLEGSISGSVSIVCDDASYNIDIRKSIAKLKEKEKLPVSGVSNNINWSIDEKGHLEVSGTGNWEWSFGLWAKDPALGLNGSVPPWNKYSDYIISAKVNLKDTTDLTGLFSCCDKLTSIDLSGLDMSKITNMSFMFADCSGLKELDLSGFDTSEVTKMDYMFGGCSGLKTLDLSRLDTSKVISTQLMFYGCSGLEELDLSRFDASEIKYMGRMFNDCDKLEVIHTPLNLNEDIEAKLPDGVWKDERGLRYTVLPCGLATSIKLTRYDRVYVYEAKEIIEKALSGMTVSNITTKADIKSVIDAALIEAGIAEVTVTVGTLNKKNATEDVDGSVIGSISIVCGSEKDKVEIKKIIAKLKEETTTNEETTEKEDIIVTDGEKVNETAPDSEISDIDENVKENIINGLTNEERKKYEKGEGLFLYLKVEDVSDDISDVDKEIIDSAKKDYNVGMYIDLSLLLKVGNGKGRSIANPGGNVEVSVALPKQLINKNKAVNREFAIIHIHDGKVELIAADYDYVANKLIFKTSGFSVFAIAYKDVASDDTAEVIVSEEQDSTTTVDEQTNENTESYDTDYIMATGDDNNLYLCILIMIMTAVGMLYIKRGLKR